MIVFVVQASMTVEDTQFQIKALSLALSPIISGSCVLSGAGCTIV